ncbi:hypothetical protein BofuT4_uP147310.1 [Botrytis cinerea T4]|uniref:Uncharacterized protein n=1 Tax=Botryotinia fuckeliana (strain T4) TaxID=999810 RepID=G2YXF0_BOTF4|nr:hypothetical protein BofuT4_uP147310.1 [Botrytis cinerea T4]
MYLAGAPDTPNFITSQNTSTIWRNLKTCQVRNLTRL